MLTPEIEINLQRREERVAEVQCAIYDAVAQYLVTRSLDENAYWGALKMAVERFGYGPVLPKQMVINLARKQFQIETQRRKIAASVPPPIRKDRFGRPIRETKTVLPSRELSAA